MTTNWVSAILVVAVFALATLWITRKASDSNYAIARGQLGTFAICASIVCHTFSGSIFIWLTMLTFLYAQWATLLFAGVFVYWTIKGLSAPRLAKLSAGKNYLSLSEFIRDRRGRKMATLINLVALYVALVLIPWQLFFANKVMANLFDISEVWAAVIVTFTVGYYVWRSGHWGSVQTDKLQMLALGLIPLSLWFYDVGGDLHAPTEVVTSGVLTREFITFVILGFAGSASLDIDRCHLAATNPAATRNGTLLGVLISLVLVYFFVQFLLILLGLSGSTEATTPEEALLGFFSNSSVPGMVILCIAISFFCAAMSTIDNHALNFSVVFSKHFLKPVENEHQFVARSRWLIIVLLIASVIISTAIERPVEWLMRNYSVLGVIAPFILDAIWREKNSRHCDDFFLLGALISAAVHFVLSAYDSYDRWSLAYGLPYALPMLFILTDRYLPAWADHLMSRYYLPLLRYLYRLISLPGFISKAD